jgi:hypothetical protein
VQHFEHRTPGTASVVKEFVAEDRVAELEKSVSVHGVGGIFGKYFEEEASRDGVYVEIMEEKGA